MATEPSTRQRLLSVIDDMELIAKELIEQLALPKAQRRLEVSDTSDLMELLIEKDTEIKEMLKICEEQEKVQKMINEIRSEVNKKDAEIRHLQRVLKEAETIMATAVYQAKQKLAAVRQAQSNKVSSEDLIKYAHRISASNAVAAPPTWGPGDPRRPYPTDLEMRHSCLSVGSLPDTSSSSGPSLSRLYSQEAQPSSHHPHPTTPQQQLGHHHHPPHHHPQPHTPQSGHSFSWQSSQSDQAATGLGGSHPSLPHSNLADALKGGGVHKDEDEVGLMSSDSSSSSSSDE